MAFIITVHNVKVLDIRPLVSGILKAKCPARHCNGSRAMRPPEQKTGVIIKGGSAGQRGHSAMFTAVRVCRRRGFISSFKC